MKKLITILFLCLLPFLSQAQYPAGSTLLYNFDMADANAIAAINGEPDSTTYYPESNTSYGQFTDAGGTNWYLQRNCSVGLHLQGDSILISTIKDGMPDNGDGYARSEVTLADWQFKLDTTHIYTLEWKGYFPQNYNYLTSWYTILVAMQIHSGTQVATVWGLNLGSDGSIFSGDVHDDYSGTDYGKGPGLVTINDTLDNYSNWYNTPHTIRVTLREGKGYTGQTAFFHIQMDGHTTYRRDTGQVGSSTWDDYVKFGGLYDWNQAMVNIDSTTRGRRFALVSDSYKVYQVPSDLADDSSVAAPTVSMSGDQPNVTTSSTSVSATASWASGHTGTYAWTQTSGPNSATFGSATSASTTVSGLVTGTYIFRCTVTQDDSQTAYGEVTVTVSIPTTHGPYKLHCNCTFKNAH